MECSKSGTGAAVAAPGATAAAAAMEDAVPTCSLFRSSLRGADSENPLMKVEASLSPHATRLSMGAEMNSFLFAPGKSLYQFQCKIPDPGTCTFVRGKGTAAPLPYQIGSTKCSLICSHQHNVQIQSVDSQVRSGGQLCIATIDARGSLVLSARSSADDPQCQNAPSTSTAILKAAQESWAGVCIEPNRGANIACSHALSRSLEVVDFARGTVAWRSSTQAAPSSIEFFSGPCAGGTGLVVAEHNHVTLWDIRRSNKRCLQRLSPSLQMIMSIKADVHSPGDLLAVGLNRTVYTIDCRNWKVRSRWRAPLKYEAVCLCVSPTVPGFCYVAGLDNDIMCGLSSENTDRNPESKRYTHKLKLNHRTGFRGDSPWCGVAVQRAAGSRDVLVAVSQDASLYIVDHATLLSAQASLLTAQ